MASFKKEGEAVTPSGAIDATTDDGISQLEGLGLPIKIVRM